MQLLRDSHGLFNEQGEISDCNEVIIEPLVLPTQLPSDSEDSSSHSSNVDSNKKAAHGSTSCCKQKRCNSEMSDEKAKSVNEFINKTRCNLYQACQKPTNIGVASIFIFVNILLILKHDNFNKYLVHYYLLLG